MSDVEKSDEESENESEFEMCVVQEIVCGPCEIVGKVEYFYRIRWRGMLADMDTWEDIKNICHLDIFKIYQESQNDKK